MGVHSPPPPSSGGGVGQGEGSGDESRGPGDEALLPPSDASEEVIVIRGERALFAPPPLALLPLPSLLLLFLPGENLPRAAGAE